MNGKVGSIRYNCGPKGAPALLLVALLFTGCSMFTESGKSNGNSRPQPTSTPVASDQSGASASPAATPAVVPSGPVLATADGDKPGVRAEVTELKRTSGDTVNLKFTLINESDKSMSFSYDFGENKQTGDFNSIAGTHLIDAVGKKKYFVVRDTEGACVCSKDLDDVKPKTRVTLFAKFPAPPADVEKITVVVPHFTPMDDVPISR
jgi:hypothetical protein